MGVPREANISEIGHGPVVRGQLGEQRGDQFIAMRCRVEVRTEHSEGWDDRSRRRKRATRRRRRRQRQRQQRQAVPAWKVTGSWTPPPSQSPVSRFVSVPEGGRYSIQQRTVPGRTSSNLIVARAAATPEWHTRPRFTGLPVAASHGVPRGKRGTAGTRRRPPTCYHIQAGIWNDSGTAAREDDQWSCVARRAEQAACLQRH